MTTTEMSRVDAAIEYAIEQLSRSDAVIEQIRESYMEITVKSPDDKLGFASADTALKRMVRLRNDVERTRKELKKDALRYGKAVDGEANRIKALIEPIETHLSTQADIVRLEKARKKVEAENKRRAEIQQWVSRLTSIGAPVNTEHLQNMTAEEFTFHFLKEKSAADKRAAELAELEELRAEKAKREAAEAAKPEPEAVWQPTPAEPSEPVAKPDRQTSTLNDFAAVIDSIPVPTALQSYADAIHEILDSAPEQIRKLGQ